MKEEKTTLQFEEKRILTERDIDDLKQGDVVWHCQSDKARLLERCDNMYVFVRRCFAFRAGIDELWFPRTQLSPGLGGNILFGHGGDTFWKFYYDYQDKEGFEYRDAFLREAEI